MARMLELIREGKVPGSMVRRAARGELALPAAEAIAILALLAEDDELGDEAEQTLRGWDEASTVEVASDPQTTPEVLRCLLWTQSERPAVIQALCENPVFPLEELEEAAGQAGPAMLEAMRRSERVRSSQSPAELLQQNTADTSAQPEPVAVGASAEAGEVAELLSAAQETEQANAHDFHAHHAAGLAEEEERPFALVSDVESEGDPLAELLQRAKHGEPAARPEEKAQLSLLQRLVHMRVGDRIKLAMRGGREERMVLIRDRSRQVAVAVVSSPKVDSSEMESYAAMKNVQEAVLRAIAGNRNNLKNYVVVRTLVANPKTPLDVSLPLMSHLLVKDLRLLAFNKNVNETIRKRASRMYKLKTEKKKG